MKDSNLKNKSSIDNQSGFTMIELMISIVLGLLISAAVIQVFITSQRVDGIQRSGSEVQSSAIFGLQSMERQIRHANLGNEGKHISDVVHNAGIVLTTDDGTDPSIVNQNRKEFNVIAQTESGRLELESSYLTIGGNMTRVGTGWTGDSNTNISSDQLTIQYKNIVKGSKLYDCAGIEISENATVIQRYFLEKDVSTDKINLLCEAGRIETVETKDNTGAVIKSEVLIKNFGNQNGSPVTIIQDIDQFNVRLGVSKIQIDKSTGKETIQHSDLSIEDYMGILPANGQTKAVRPFITSIRLAILAKSNANTPEASADEFVIFGKKQILTSAATQKKHFRKVFETSIVLRNARLFIR